LLVFLSNRPLPGKKGRNRSSNYKGVPNTTADLAALISVEATAVYIPIGNSEVFLAAVLQISKPYME
jgi:hypothetical protein